MMSLTKRQSELLKFIKAYQADNDWLIPSYREMADHMKVNSLSGIRRLILGLEDRGAIRRAPHRARAIEVLNLNAAQAQQIARISAENDRLRKALSEESK